MFKIKSLFFPPKAEKSPFILLSVLNYKRYEIPSD